jgi:hypothetical protein
VFVGGGANATHKCEALHPQICTSVPVSSKSLDSFFGSQIDQCISLKEERQPKEPKKKDVTIFCTD